MRTRALLSMFTVLFAASLLPPTVEAQSGIALEARVGGTFGSGDLGITTGPSAGYFDLGEVAAAPTFGVGLVLPSPLAGLRPHAVLSYSPPADVGGTWLPCEPGFACESILLTVDGRASRLEMLVGAELPLRLAPGPALPYLSAGVGLRRYGISWSPVGEAGGIFLDEGSYGETDFLARVALGVGFRFGAMEALVEGGADLSAFGAGRVPVPTDQLALYAEPTIDLGRTSQEEYSLTVGIRRHFR